MSGHSKWSTIKRKKWAQDAKRGQVFSKLAKEISVAARLGGGDPEMNPRLRTVLLEARSQNMPKDNVDRAIKKGTGELPGASYEETHYEGYAPGGVAVLVEVLTDNKNRTVAEIRHLLTKYGGSMAEHGAVLWNFEQKGYMIIPRGEMTEEEAMEKAIEAGADDVTVESDFVEIFTDPQELHTVGEALQNMGFTLDTQKFMRIPKTTVQVEGGQAQSVMKLMEALEDQEDVQNVYANFDIADEEMAEAMGG
ncbi:MAG: YebC/PmpR family DNA-binding transcriptional regulator [Candidatus Hydrogenedentota bacterium]